MLIKVTVIQSRLGCCLSLEEKMYVFKQRPDFICLPEFCLLDASTTDFQRAALRRPEHLEQLSRLSYELSTCIIAGTVVDATNDKLYNASYIFNRGEKIGRYRKRFPVPKERQGGISPGNENLVVEIEGVRVGLMICGDVFEQRMFEELGEMDVDIIFVPTTSPYLPDDSLSRKNHRDNRYFVRGARTSASYVVKACGVGTLFGRPLQGRSLLAAPWGIINRVEASYEQRARIITETLDIQELRDFRTKYRQLADHNKQGCTEKMEISALSD